MSQKDSFVVFINKKLEKEFENLKNDKSVDVKLYDFIDRSI
jgi:hypothetical protein